MKSRTKAQITFGREKIKFELKQRKRGKVKLTRNDNSLLTGRITIKPNCELISERLYNLETTFDPHFLTMKNRQL